jgi:hypothetical protein
MNKKILAEAVRLEYESKTGELFIVFKVKDEKFKQDIKTKWVNDIEYKLIDKLLVEEE